MDTFANMDTTVDKNTPYIRRPWIFTALSLRFNEAMTYREIAEKLNISSSAVHKMFTRFRRTGINWPLEFKIRIADLTLQPGACVAQIAREHGINDNLLFNWLTLPGGSLSLTGPLTPELLRVLVSELREGEA